VPTQVQGLIVDHGGVLDDELLELLRRARRHGLRTALLSNAEAGEPLPEHRWEGAFDAVVTSARSGLRKPDPDIYRHTATLLGLSPEACVFVDDLRSYVDGAVTAGMVGVVHRSFADTCEELEILFGVELR
jgi:HAD superfamily hydrolase (TIGR01509 family)